jgi:hypothetical protein
MLSKQEHSANSTGTQTSSSRRLAAHNDGMHQTMSKSRSFAHEPRTPASLANCQQHRARAIGSRPGRSPSSRHCPSHARLPLAVRRSAGRCGGRDTTLPCGSTPRPPLTHLRRPVTSQAQRRAIASRRSKLPPATRHRCPARVPPRDAAARRVASNSKVAGTHLLRHGHTGRTAIAGARAPRAHPSGRTNRLPAAIKRPPRSPRHHAPPACSSLPCLATQPTEPPIFLCRGKSPSSISLSEPPLPKVSPG